MLPGITLFDICGLPFQVQHAIHNPHNPGWSRVVSIPHKAKRLLAREKRRWKKIRQRQGKH